MRFYFHKTDKNWEKFNMYWKKILFWKSLIFEIYLELDLLWIVRWNDNEGKQLCVSTTFEFNFRELILEHSLEKLLIKQNPKNKYCVVFIETEIKIETGETWLKKYKNVINRNPNGLCTLLEPYNCYGNSRVNKTYVL